MGRDMEKKLAYRRERYAANREKQRAYCRKYRLANREKIQALAIDRCEKKREIKQLAVDFKGGICCKCRVVHDPIVYHFHHEDHTKKEYDISVKIFNLASATKSVQDCFELIKKELDKTILVCANCHAMIHEEEGYLHNRNRTSTQSSEDIYSEPTVSPEPQYSAIVTTERPHTYIQMILVDLDGDNEREMAG